MCSTQSPQQPHDGLLWTTSSGSDASAAAGAVGANGCADAVACAGGCGCGDCEHATASTTSAESRTPGRGMVTTFMSPSQRLRCEDQWMWAIRHPCGVSRSTIVSVLSNVSGLPSFVVCNSLSLPI